MLSFSSLPMFAGTLVTGIAYTGMSLFTTAAKTTINLTGAATDAVIGIVGGPWIQIPFRVVRSVAQPVVEKTVETTILGTNLATGAIVGTTVYLGQRLFLYVSGTEKLKKDLKNEEWVLIADS